MTGVHAGAPNSAVVAIIGFPRNKLGFVRAEWLAEGSIVDTKIRKIV